jgi:hypothetical protein
VFFFAAAAILIQGAAEIASADTVNGTLNLGASNWTAN